MPTDDKKELTLESLEGRYQSFCATREYLIVRMPLYRSKIFGAFNVDISDN